MLAKFSVKKPYTVVVGIIVVLILGFVSYTKMSLDLIPSINMPYAVVVTTYPGAAPEQVEMAVTSPLEQALASVNNVKNIQSFSSDNMSIVMLEFNASADMTAATIDMRESLDLVTAYFPDQIGSPMILKLNPDMLPIMVTSVSVGDMADSEAAKFIDDKIIPDIKSIEGVASVTASGMIENFIGVTLTETKINAFNQNMKAQIVEMAEVQIRSAILSEIEKSVDEGLAPQIASMTAQGMTEQEAKEALSDTRKQLIDGALTQSESVVQAQLDAIEIPDVDITKDMINGILSGQNFSMPAGSVKSDDNTSYLIRVGDKFKSADDLKGFTLINIPGYGDVKLSDVADINIYDNTSEIYSRVNNNYAIMLSIEKQPDYPTADVSKTIAEKLEALETEYSSVSFNVLMSQGEYIDLMINSILKNLLFGAGLAIIILFFFLRKIKPTLIVGASILISVVTAFVLMYFSGISLNMISMGGLALGVGMLVDNSIVVIENIYRMMSEGKSAREASIEGAKEVTGAIFASTLTTIVVFLPIVFTEGITRQLFTDMALTIAYSLIASLIVALTLVPAAASSILGKKFEAKKTIFDKIAASYSKVLEKSLKHRWITILLAIVLLGGSVAAAFSSGTELFPSMESNSLAVSVKMPDNYTKEDIYSALDKVYDTLDTVEGIETIGIMYVEDNINNMMMMGGGTTVYALLDENKKVSTSSIIEEIRTKTENFEFEVSASNSNMDISMLSGGAVVVNIYGRDLDNIRQTAKEVAEIVRSAEGTIEVEDGLGKTGQELRITVDKSKAIANGLTVAQVFMAVNEAITPASSTTTISDGEIEYSVIVNDERKGEIKTDDVKNITVTGTNGQSVKVGDIAQIDNVESFNRIQRINQERTVSVTASLMDGYDSGTVNKNIEKLLKDYTPQAGCRISQAGENEMIAKTFKDLILMILLAIVFIYLVMVAQFQSILSPFIIMFTIPLAFTGGFLSLFLSGTPVSAVALIGFVVLVGIVVNNGIVFIDYANQQMKAGLSKTQALVITAKNRIRPILMTALTTILALVTMVIDTSTGSEMTKPMAITTIGGLVYATFLTLFLIPALYSIMIKDRNKKAEVTDEG